jgi:hypothetical protein
LVLTILDIAFSIPDFEGQAILRIFANSTEDEIACYTSAITNGNSFNQQESVGSILGIFTFVAIVSSIATAIYGDSVTEIRTHHAHSLSVLVVFAVFHHIYFTGALSMNWPSVLVAFWGNFAWAAGMIYNSSMQDSLSKLVGKYLGNTLVLGAARAGADSSSVGGGYDIQKIYKRQFETARIFGRATRPVTYHSGIAKRSLLNSTSGFKWYGTQVRPGLPLPGNYSGFAGTLSKEGIPAANAFLTGLIWFLILILIIVGTITIFKYTLDLLYKLKWMKTQRLNYFRQNWRRYLVFALLKACYIAFFLMTFLTIFQFSYGGAPAAISIAAIVFAIFFIGMFSICAYACRYRLRVGKWVSEPDRFFVEKTKTLGFLPWFRLHQGYKVHDSERVFSGSIPGWRLSRNPEPTEIPVHEDENYIRKFGWLSSRYRLSKWWFFALWIVYEFIRACFYAGASGHALVQVFCILIVEIVAFIVIIKIKPYEGQRLNVIMVYLLGFSKVLTVALSSAFDIAFSIARIPATVIGVLIIIIQALLVIALLICIVLSAISSYFSVTRNREQIKPKKWMPYRERYFAHIKQRATDLPPPIPEVSTEIEEPSAPKDPYFSVNSVRRMAKIEDEDREFQKDIYSDPRSPNRFSDANLPTEPVQSPPTKGLARRHSVAHSIQSNMSHSSLPYAAALHRGSWTTKEFAEFQQEADPTSDRFRSSTYVSRRSSRESFPGSRPVSKTSRPPFIVGADDISVSPVTNNGGSADGSPKDTSAEFDPASQQQQQQEVAPTRPTSSPQRSVSAPSMPRHVRIARATGGGSLKNRDGGIQEGQTWGSSTGTP